MMNKPEFPKPRIIRESFLPEPMTEFYPKKQTPEQVDEGLRDAMKQVKKRDERSQRLRELYDAARKARENVNEKL